MSTRAIELRLEYFRGATRPVKIAFDSKKQLVVVFGENGTGKSTIVDAFDMVAHGVLGSLEGRSSASNKHVPAIGKKPKDVKVTLRMGESQWDGEMNGRKVNVIPADERPLIDILRRKQLLSFVEARPGERYKVLQRFIDVSGVEDSEQQALEALNEAKSDNTKAIDAKLEAESKLKGLWETNRKPGESWLEWAAEKSVLATDSLSTSIKSLQSIIANLQGYQTRKTDYEAAVNHVDDSVRTLEIVESEFENQQSSWSNQTPSLISALEATTSLLDAGWERDACPVCSQTINPQDLRSQVADALGSMKALKAANEKHKAAKTSVDQANRSLRNDTQQIASAIIGVIDSAEAVGHADIEAMNLNLSSHRTKLQAETIAETDFAAAITSIDALADIEAKLVTQKEESERDKHQLHTIQTEYRTHTEAEDDIRQSDALRQKLEQIHGIVMDQRKRFVEDILDSVSTEVDRLYSLIHPDEDVKSGRLKLATNKRASLLQYGEFAGEKDIEPQGYFSDSHLDTLGFCCWWALAKRENGEQKIVVLDDVFTSVDAPHLSRILELLDTECCSFAQVFAFTHSRYWRDRYRYNQAAGGKTQLVQLRRWTASRGLCHNKTELELDELVRLLSLFREGSEDVDRQELASRCGILLEAILSHLSMNYQCSVPHRVDGDYTLGDLINGCSKLMKVLQVQRIAKAAATGDDSDLQPPQALRDVFGKLCTLSFIRNQVGCHFNLAGASMSDAEVEQFGNATVIFARAVVCEECGEVPRTDKSLFRQCTCKRTRLIPAKA